MKIDYHNMPKGAGMTTFAIRYIMNIVFISFEISMGEIQWFRESYGSHYFCQRHENKYWS